MGAKIMRPAGISLALVALFLFSGCRQGTETQASARPRVLIVSIDGLRPDVAMRANMPQLRRLCANGAFTFWARTTEVSITLPSHTSMLTGVVEGRHEIWWNQDIPKSYIHHPAVPSIFELAKSAGYSTAMAAGKAKFVAISRPGSLDWSYIKDSDDTRVARAAAGIIRTYRPELLMVHLPGMDAAGHARGWGSAHQIAAAEVADRALGVVLGELRRQRLLDSTTIIVTADHGGAGWSHGADDPRSRHVPWIISGPGIKRNYDLTLDVYRVVNIEDTFATACMVLNLPIDEDLDGQPVTQALEDAENPAVVSPAY